MTFSALFRGSVLLGSGIAGSLSAREGSGGLGSWKCIVSGVC